MPSRKATVRMGLTQAEVGVLLNLSQPSISAMVKQGRFKLFPDRTIDPESDLLKPIFDNPDSDDVSFDGDDTPEPDPLPTVTRQDMLRDSVKVYDFFAERARREKAQADLTELKVLAARGMYIPKDTAETTQIEIYLHVREGIEDAVERCSAILATKFGLAEPAVRKEMSDHFHGVLTRLAEEVEARAGT